MTEIKIEFPYGSCVIQDVQDENGAAEIVSFSACSEREALIAKACEEVGNKRIFSHVCDLYSRAFLTQGFKPLDQVQPLKDGYGIKPLTTMMVKYEEKRV
jgi:hypothetical protein